MQNGCLEAWKAWLEIRKKKGWPNTDFALRMAVKELEKLKNEGNDPQAIIESAVLKAYRSFYPLKPDYQPSMNFSSHRPPEAKKSNVRIL
jgi:hypothetical protein